MMTPLQQGLIVIGFFAAASLATVGFVALVYASSAYALTWRRRAFWLAVAVGSGWLALALIMLMAAPAWETLWCANALGIVGIPLGVFVWLGEIRYSRWQARMIGKWLGRKHLDLPQDKYVWPDDD
jgi:hypothetical protein